MHRQATPYAQGRGQVEVQFQSLSFHQINGGSAFQAQYLSTRAQVDDRYRHCTDNMTYREEIRTTTTQVTTQARTVYSMHHGNNSWTPGYGVSGESKDLPEEFSDPAFDSQDEPDEVHLEVVPSVSPYSASPVHNLTEEPEGNQLVANGNGTWENAQDYGHGHYGTNHNDEDQDTNDNGQDCDSYCDDDFSDEDCDSYDNDGYDDAW